MTAVVTRVLSAACEIDGKVSAEIGVGFLVLLGVMQGDSESDADYLARKLCGLRIFSDKDGKMNLGLADVGGSLLVVSNFTLAGDCKKGFRPSFDRAMEPQSACALYEHFVARCRESIADVQTGVFRAHMEISSKNDGPVTLILSSR